MVQWKKTNMLKKKEKAPCTTSYPIAIYMYIHAFYHKLTAFWAKKKVLAFSTLKVESRSMVDKSPTFQQTTLRALAVNFHPWRE